MYNITQQNNIHHVIQTLPAPHELRRPSWRSRTPPALPGARGTAPPQLATQGGPPFLTVTRVAMRTCTRTWRTLCFMLARSDVY